MTSASNNECYTQLAVLAKQHPKRTIIVRDVAGLKGFSVALNVFSDKRHRKLFELYDLAHRLVLPSAPPAVPAMRNSFYLFWMSFPNDWWRLQNVCRDLLDNKLPLCDINSNHEYPLGASFPYHKDSRYANGELIFTTCLGAPCMLNFRLEDKFSKGVAVEQFPYRKPWYYMSVLLPANCIYTFTGEVFDLWEHGVNQEGKFDAILNAEPTPPQNAIDETEQRICLEKLEISLAKGFERKRIGFREVLPMNRAEKLNAAKEAQIMLTIIASNKRHLRFGTRFDRSSKRRNVNAAIDDTHQSRRSQPTLNLVTDDDTTVDIHNDSNVEMTERNDSDDDDAAAANDDDDDDLAHDGSAIRNNNQVNDDLQQYFRHATTCVNNNRKHQHDDHDIDDDDATECISETKRSTRHDGTTSFDDDNDDDNSTTTTRPPVVVVTKRRRESANTTATTSTAAAATATTTTIAVQQTPNLESLSTAQQPKRPRFEPGWLTINEDE